MKQNQPKLRATSFVCPHCSDLTKHTWWGRSFNDIVHEDVRQNDIWVGRCASCEESTVWIGSIMAYPKGKRVVSNASKPDAILISGIGFYNNGIDSYNRLIDESVEVLKFQHAVVAATNASFGIELLLKGMIAVLTHKVNPQGHYMDKLFKMLPDKMREGVNHVYNMYIADIVNFKSIKLHSHKTGVKPKKPILDGPLPLHEFLRSHRDAFVAWRYAYEPHEDANLFEFNFNLTDCFVRALVLVFKALAGHHYYFRTNDYFTIRKLNSDT